MIEEKAFAGFTVLPDRPIPSPSDSARRRATFTDPTGRGILSALAETAARALGSPWASVTLLDGDRVGASVIHGFQATGPTDDFAFSRTFANLREAFVVDDATTDARFARSHFSFGPREARAYATVPIVGSDGSRFGALAVLEPAPRRFDAGNVETLVSIARLAAREIEAHAELLEANAARSELASVIAASPMAIVTADLSGRVSSWSPATERMSGYSAAQVIGRFPPWVPGGRNNRDFREMLAAIARGATYVNLRTKRLRANGMPVEIRVSAAPMFGDDGNVTGFVTVSENVAEMKRSERRLYLLESVISRTSDAVFVTSSLPANDPKITWVNDAFVQLFGFQGHEIVGKSLSDLNPSGLDAQQWREVRRALRDRVSIRGMVSYQRKNGEHVWCDSSLSPVVEADGRCENFVVIARDATERRRSERLQKDRGEILEMIAADVPLEQTFARLIATAERARPGAGALIRLRRGDLLYRSACGPALGEMLGPFAAPVTIDDESVPCGRAVARSEQVVAEVDGTFASWSSPMRTGAGELFGTFAMFAGVADPPAPADLRLGAEFAHLAGIAMERQEDRKQLEFLAMHDPLTGLPNRKLFETRLDETILEAEKRGRQVALGLIDLDRFKLINDSLGHAAGDQLLRDVATRLQRSVRPGDTLARMGGDEFVLLIEDLGSRDEAQEIAERVLLALVPSFDCDGQEIFVHASMGLSTYPADARDGRGLLALGDAAMYQVKSQGRDVAFHVSSDAPQGIARIALETSLNYALENGEFEVLFQPQVELRTREVRGAEALLRWNHPSKGQLLPSAFVPAAEDTGLIVPIGARMLEEACRFARRWQDEGFERFVSLNVAARQFDRPEFVESVARTLETTGLAPGRLHLELTESLMMRSPETAAATLQQLKDLGVKIVVDDFGTGYSSFHYLKRFPLDALKIAPQFVRDIGFGSRAPNEEGIVRAIIGVARALDLKIVAEGVESEDQVAFLRAIGVGLAQGDLFAPGLTSAAALRWTKVVSRR